jgi:hypothetical protein
LTTFDAAGPSSHHGIYLGAGRFKNFLTFRLGFQQACTAKDQNHSPEFA